jgi:hypothetical protein
MRVIIAPKGSLNHHSSRTSSAPPPSSSQNARRLCKAARRINHETGAFDTLVVIDSTILS